MDDLELLLKPSDVGCVDEYCFGDCYCACITRSGEYIVYDKASTIHGYEQEIRELERVLRRKMLMGRGVEKVLEKLRAEYRCIAERHMFGYGVLEPLLQDPEIIDVHIVAGKKISIIHRRHGRLETRIVLGAEALQNIVMKMMSRAGKTVSETQPLYSFIEPRYNVRVSLVYLSDITLHSGMTVDIRKQPETPWTIIKLVKLGTLTLEQATLLWMYMLYRVPVLIIGEVFSGKTTLANAVLNLVPPDSRIITIEDTPELNLYVEYWTRTVTREHGSNPITIFDILKTAVRMTVDYIVVGEIRGEEAREWIHALLLGHSGVSTFHADSPETAYTRLVSPPISVDRTALEYLNVYVRMKIVRTDTGVERKAEIYVYEDNEFKPLYTYDPGTGKMVRHGDPLNYRFVERIAGMHGMSMDELRRQYRCMMDIMEKIYGVPGSETMGYRELAEKLYGELRRHGYY